MTTRVLTEDQILESYMQIAEPRSAWGSLRQGTTLERELARLRAQQANNSQENQKTAKTVKLNEQLAKTAKDQLNEQLARQETAKDQQTEIARRRKKKPGESRASHEPPLPRIRTTICEGGVEVDGGDIRQGIGIGRLDNDGHRGTITIKRILAGKDVKEDQADGHRGVKKDQVSMEELVLPPFKEEHQVRIADDLDSGQGPPSSRKEPAMCGLLTMRGLLAEQLFTVHEPFTANGLDSGQEPPSPKEEQQGGTSRDIDIGDIDSATETENGAARMPATEEPCVPTLVSDSSDYDFGYNFKISDMSTIMKDKGLRPALGG